MCLFSNRHPRAMARYRACKGDIEEKYLNGETFSLIYRTTIKLHLSFLDIIKMRGGGENLINSGDIKLEIIWRMRFFIVRFPPEFLQK